MSVLTRFQTVVTKIRAFERTSVLEFMALFCMVISMAGASGVFLWEWWPFAVLSSMFFLAGNLHKLRSVSIGLTGVKAETREIADSPAVDTKETWKERDRLELYVLANLSVGNEPHSSPVNRDPALSRLRLLKDAAREGKLSYQGDTANMFATVKVDDFTKYVRSCDVEDFETLAEQWQQVHEKESRHVEIAPYDEERLRLARLRTAGVHLRNRSLRPDDIADWRLEVRDWALAVAAGIQEIDAADAEWFRTLDAVPPPRVNLGDLSPEYSKTFRELDYMLVKLEILLTKYSASKPDSSNNDK